MKKNIKMSEISIYNNWCRRFQDSAGITSITLQNGSIVEKR